MRATPTTLADPHEALASLIQRVQPVDTQSLALAHAAGRILAEDVCADRPSPACDVSAMDGYALRYEDIAQCTLPVTGEVVMGQAPPQLSAGSAVRIFTGGAVPDGADTVIQRERVTEHGHAIELDPTIETAHGANIRRRGENIDAGAPVAAAGTAITPAVAAALANFGVVQPRVHRPVRIAILTTGNELLPPDESPTPWQLRDSNTETLRHLFGALPWGSLVSVNRVTDDRGALVDALAACLDQSDAVLLTGGVSMGDHDYVPSAIERIGGEVVFHKVALRPGKPLLGALGPRGQVIFGLPGNPVSVMVTARRFVTPVLRTLAGCATNERARPMVTAVNPDERTLKLWWYRPVRFVGDGEVELVASKGSGDLVSTAASDGFVELPPAHSGAGPWPFYTWDIGVTG